jgi:hypothetical protein
VENTSLEFLGIAPDPNNALSSSNNLQTTVNNDEVSAVQSKAWVQEHAVTYSLLYYSKHRIPSLNYLAHKAAQDKSAYALEILDCLLDFIC